MTNGEKYGPAMSITHQSEADAWLRMLVKRCMDASYSREEAEAIERSNLAYYAGYYDAETRERVERLFRCQHPAFGPASAGEPTALHAYGLGALHGTAARPAVQQQAEAEAMASRASKLPR